MSASKTTGRGPSHHGGDHDKDDRPRRRKAGRERAVHVCIAKRRQAGGAPATPEAYARALTQWHELAGAVWHGPSEMTIPPADVASEVALARADTEAKDGSHEAKE